MTPQCRAQIFLGSRRTTVQWAALTLLALGMATTKLCAEGGHRDERAGRQLRGISVLLLNGCLSGASGVLNEYLIKMTDPQAPLMFKNMHIYFFCALAALPTWKAGEGTQWGALPWVIVFANAATGLCVSLVLKYADVLVKGFSTSAAVLLAAIASALCCGFVVTTPFAVGLAVVSCSFYLYFGPHNAVLAAADEKSSALVSESNPTRVARAERVPLSSGEMSDGSRPPSE